MPAELQEALPDGLLPQYTRTCEGNCYQQANTWCPGGITQFGLQAIAAREWIKEIVRCICRPISALYESPVGFVHQRQKVEAPNLMKMAAEVKACSWRFGGIMTLFTLASRLFQSSTSCCCSCCGMWRLLWRLLQLFRTSGPGGHAGLSAFSAWSNACPFCWGASCEVTDSGMHCCKAAISTACLAEHVMKSTAMTQQWTKQHPGQRKPWRLRESRYRSESPRIHCSSLCKQN